MPGLEKLNKLPIIMTSGNTLQALNIPVQPNSSEKKKQITLEYQARMKLNFHDQKRDM